jgi:hypothetical protein
MGRALGWSGRRIISTEFNAVRNLEMINTMVSRRCRRSFVLRRLNTNSLVRQRKSFLHASKPLNMLSLSFIVQDGVCMFNKVICFVVVSLVITTAGVSANDRKQFFSVGYDFYTIMKAVDGKSSGIGYEQTDSGLTLSWSFEVENDNYIIAAYRDAGVGEISCNELNAVIEVDGANYYCSTYGTTEPEASSWSLAYKFSNPGNFEWKLGVGTSFITYPNSSIDDNDNTGLYVGWERAINSNEDGSGLYLDFGTTIGQTFGLGLKYQFATD